ncbi:MAG: GHMP kinase [Candidatus Brocadiaceae bacterium]|nr:GHMP kinase [Candidatus Brocadiaceae bacterium]
MIITRTPFRVSFVGGGSDLVDFYCRNGYGAVVSATIKKYMYIVIHPYFHDKIRLKYSKTEDVSSVEEIEHPIIKECMKKVNVERGIEIASFADIPAGTGLGSSSAFTVGLLNALYSFKGQLVSKERLAREACEIEIDILKEPIGKQDQYAVSYGGINYIKFNNDESVFVEKILCSAETKELLRKSLLMFYLGGNRKASNILEKQRENMVNIDKYNKLKEMVSLADEAKEVFTISGIDSIGKILHKGWLLKRCLCDNISNDAIDNYYNVALNNGCSGGKLLGAGGSGFLMFYCEPDHQKALRAVFPLKELDVEFDQEGTKVIFFD